MKRRYFFWFTVAFLAGIALAAGGYLPAAAIAAAGLFLGGLLLHTYGYRKVLLMAMLGMVIGFFCFFGHFTRYNAKITAIGDNVVTVQGRITDIREADRLRLLVRGSVQGADFLYENISVYVYPDGENRYAYGDTVSFTAAASVPDRPRNFGETDYRHYCMGRGIYAFFYPEEGEMTVTGHSFSLLRPGDAAFALRTRVQTAISGRTSEASEGFLRALLTGDKNLLYAETGENLQKAGLSHVVAVSGLHLQIIVGAAMALFGLMKIRRRTFSVVFYLLLVWFFVLFTGASASVLRAALMLSLTFLASFFRRDSDSLTALAFAAFALCIINPGMLFDIGFQLSCASTLGILLFAGKFSGYLSALPRFLRTGLAVSLAAFAGFAPLAAYHFGVVSLVGILANLLVCPLLSVLMIAGFLAAATAGVPGLSDALFFCLDLGVRYILWVAALCARLPFAAASLRQPGVLAFSGYLTAAMGLYALTEKRRRRAGWLFCLVLVLFAGEAAGVLRDRQSAAVTFLSVGNGDCALVQLEGRTMLFDSGGSAYTDVGENTVLPYLRQEGIAKIDAAFLTHYHTDHAAGFLSLLENGCIGTLYLPAAADSSLKPALAAKAQALGVRVRYLGDGDTVTLSALTVSAFDTADGNEENNGLVYRLDVPGGRVLFTGDIDKNGERRLVYRGADIDCDILKVPHHGSDTSGLAEFTAAVSPEAAVISCGKNHYGHPADSVLDAYAAANVPVFRTDTQGTVRVRIFADGRRKIETLWP